MKMDLGITNTFKQMGAFTRMEFMINEDPLYIFLITVP
jgi:hypothetical protein